MTALSTLALEVPVIAAGIWFTGAALFYGSQYIRKVDAWLNQTDTKLVNYGHTEAKAFASVVTTIVINSSKEGKPSTHIVTSDGGATSTSEETIPGIPEMAENGSDRPTALPEGSVLIGDKWLKQRKISNADVPTKTKIKSPLTFSATKLTNLEKFLDKRAEGIKNARVIILRFFTKIGNFFTGNLQHDFEWLRYASSTFSPTTTSYNTDSHNTSFHSRTCIILDCNIFGIFEAIWSAPQFIGSQLSVLLGYIAVPLIWTSTKITIPLLRWFILDIVCPPPFAAFRYASDWLSLISKWSSQIWSIYKESDNMLFFIALVLVIFGCVYFCCFQDGIFGGKDDNYNPDGDPPRKTSEETFTGPSPPPFTGHISTNNTSSEVTPRVPRDMTNLPELIDTERHGLHIEAEENVAHEEEEQNSVYGRENDGTKIRDLISTHSLAVSHRPIPDFFPNDARKERAARLEKLAAQIKKEKEELPQRLRAERERRYQESLQKKQSDLRKRQSEEETRVQEARNQLRSTAMKFLALEGGKIKNTTLQPKTTFPTDFIPETDKLSTTVGGKVKTTIVEALVRQPTITTVSLVQTPALADLGPHVHRGHNKNCLNKKNEETDENGTPLINITSVQQPASQTVNDKTGSRRIEDPFKKDREPLGIFEVNEKKGMVKYAGVRSSPKPEIEEFNQSVTPGLNQPVIGGPEDKKDGGFDIMPGGRGAIVRVIRDSDIILSGYAAVSTGGPSISGMQFPNPRNTDASPSIPATVVENTLLHAPSMPKFNNFRRRSGKKSTPRTSVNASTTNEPLSTPSFEPYDPTHPGLPTSTELTTTKTVEPYDQNKPGLSLTSPVDQHGPTKLGLIHGPNIQYPAQLAVSRLTQPTLSGLSLPTVNATSQSDGQRTIHPAVPGPTQSTIQSPVQSHGGDVIMEDAPPLLIAPSAPSIPPTIDDGEEMVVDGGNEKLKGDNGNINMGEGDDSPEHGGGNQPPGVFGSSLRTDGPAPQPPATIKTSPRPDDMNMGKDTPDTTMGEDSPQPFSFGTAMATHPITIIPAPLRPNSFGTLSAQRPSTTSMRSSFSSGQPMEAPVGNAISIGQPIQAPITSVVGVFGGGQSTQALITTPSGGHSTQGPLINASGESQHSQSITISHTSSTEPFSTTGVSSPGTSSDIPSGANIPNNSGSLTLSQQAKIMTQMIKYAKGDSGTFSATAVSGESSIDPSTSNFPPAIITVTRDSSISFISGTGSPPSIIRPSAGSTARKTSNTRSKVISGRSTSTGGMNVVRDPLRDVEGAEKAHRKAIAKKQKKKEFEEEGNRVSQTPRKILKPKVRALNTKFLQKGDSVNGGKVDTSVKRDNSPNRNNALVVPGPTIPPEETDNDRRLRELTAKMETQASQRRREMNKQNIKLEFGTPDDIAAWHKITGNDADQATFTKEDFLERREDFMRLRRRAREAKIEFAADALVKKINAADPASKTSEEKDARPVLTIPEEVARNIARRVTETKEMREDDEDSEISDVDEADLACIKDQVNHNQALKDDAERLMKQQEQAEDSETDPDNKIDDGWEADINGQVDLTAYQFSNLQDSPEDPAGVTKRNKSRECKRVHELTVHSNDPRDHWGEKCWKPGDDYEARVAAGEDGPKNEHVEIQRPVDLREEICGGWKEVREVVVEKVNEEAEGKINGDEQIGRQDAVDEDSEFDQEWEDVPVNFNK